MAHRKRIESPKIVKNYIGYLKSVRSYSKETVHGYETDLVLFLRFMKIHFEIVDEETKFEEINVKDVNKEFIQEIELIDIYAFLGYLEEARGYAKATKARKIATIRSFYYYLHKKAKWVEENLGEELESPGRDKPSPTVLSFEEGEKLLLSVTGRNKIRDYCILVLFLNTGVRLSELCGMNISERKSDSIKIKGKGSKERTVYLNESCVFVLDIYMKYVRNKWADKVPESSRDALFLSERKQRISKRSVEVIVENAIRNAGLSKKYTTHKLRHTAATSMYRAGVDIRVLKDILGHESVATTQIYAHVFDEQLKQAVTVNPFNIVPNIDLTNAPL